MKANIIFINMFPLLQEHLKNDDKICLLLASACFQQPFYDWFSEFKYNSELVLYSLILNFSKCYFKTSAFCLLFFFSHIFTALEFDSNYFGILLWKIVNPRDHNEIKLPIGKILSRKLFLCWFINNV